MSADKQSVKNIYSTEIRPVHSPLYIRPIIDLENCTRDEAVYDIIINPFIHLGDLVDL